MRRCDRSRGVACIQIIVAEVSARPPLGKLQSVSQERLGDDHFMVASRSAGVGLLMAKMGGRLPHGGGEHSNHAPWRGGLWVVHGWFDLGPSLPQSHQECREVGCVEQGLPAELDRSQLTTFYSCIEGRSTDAELFQYFANAVCGLRKSKFTGISK